MLPPDLDSVTHSYHRCLSSERFLDTFYEKFLGKSDEIASKFRMTDFDRQKRMLRESLLMMVMFNRDPEMLEEDMTALATRHGRQGVDIPARLYAHWLDALCEAVKEHDPQYSADIGMKWRKAMEQGIKFIISRY